MSVSLPPHLAGDRQEAVGARVQALRQTTDDSRELLGAVIGVRPSMMGHIERGIRPLRLSQALVIARRYGVTVDFIVTGDLRMVPVEVAERLGIL